MGLRLFLIRHGDAVAGFSGVIGGPVGCVGLTDLGRAQAAALRDHLERTGRVKADVLVSSIIPRAIETAEIIAPGLGMQTFSQHCDLCEVHTGEADGLEWTEYGERYGSFDMQAVPDRVFAPEGESWNSFHDRVGSMLDRLAREYDGKTVVAVCHAGVIQASMRVLLRIPRHEAETQLHPTNTGLTDWQYRDGRWILHSFNETSHLAALREAAERIG